MSAKVVSTVLSLKDNFTNQLMAMTSKSQKIVKKMGNQFNSFKYKVSNTFKKIGKEIVKSLASVTIAMSKFLKSSLNAFNNYNEQVTKLKDVMVNTKGTTKGQIDAVVKYSNTLQDTGVISETVILAGTQQIATYQLQADTLKTLMPGMADLIAKQKGLNATTADAVNIGDMIGRVMDGQVGVLSKMGMNFTQVQEQILKFGTKAERAATLTEILKQNIGGTNEALRKTPKGTMLAFSNSLISIKRELGGKLQPIIIKIINSLIKKLPIIKEKLMKIIDKIVDIGPAIEDIALKGIDFIIEAFDTLIDTIDFVSNNWGWIKKVSFSFLILIGVIKSIIAIIKIYKGLTIVFNFVKEIFNKITESEIIEQVILTTAIKIHTGVMWGYQKIVSLIIAIKKSNILQTIASTTVQWLYNAAITAGAVATWALNAALAILTSPITLVIAGIAALIGVAYMVWKHFDTIKKVVGDLWKQFKNTSVFKGVMGFFETLGGIIDTIANGISNIVEGIKNLVSGGINKVKGWFGFGEDVPQNALGTNNFIGGPTLINERGGELINLPSGAQIIPADKTKAMITNNKQGDIRIQLTIQGNVIGNKQYAKDIASTIVNELELARGNL